MNVSRWLQQQRVMCCFHGHIEGSASFPSLLPVKTISSSSYAEQPQIVTDVMADPSSAKFYCSLPLPFSFIYCFQHGTVLIAHRRGGGDRGFSHYLLACRSVCSASPCLSVSSGSHLLV